MLRKDGHNTIVVSHANNPHGQAQLGPFKVPGITEHLDYIKGTLVDYMDVLCSYAVDSGIPVLAVFVVVSRFRSI